MANWPTNPSFTRPPNINPEQFTRDNGLLAEVINSMINNDEYLRQHLGGGNIMPGVVQAITLPPGSPATLQISFTPDPAVANSFFMNVVMGIPKGQIGQTGQDGKDGKDGEIGPPPITEVDGTLVRWQLPDGTFTTWTDFQGPIGAPGSNATTGTDVGLKVINIEYTDWQGTPGKYFIEIPASQHNMGATNSLLVFEKKLEITDLATSLGINEPTVDNTGLVTVQSTYKWKGLILICGGIAEAVDYTARDGVTALNNKLAAPNGIATLDSAGKVLANQLPSYVDDVLEFPKLADFPAVGESGKIYIAIDTNLTYRWGGSSYVIISQSLALGETSSTAYRGDRGKTAYDHSQTSGNPHSTTADGVGAYTKAQTDALINTANQNNIIQQTANIYLSALNTLTDSKPTATVNQNIALNGTGTTVVTINYTSPVSGIVSPQSTYGFTLLLTSLQANTQYNFTNAEWRIGTTVISRTAFLFSTATGQTNAYITIPFTSNLLATNANYPANQQFTLAFQVSKSSGGNDTITISSTVDSPATFTRNGGEISSGNVYDNDGSTLATVAQRLRSSEIAISGKADTSALNAHISNYNNPHATSKEQVGLGNVKNFDTTNAGNIENGTLNALRLPIDLLNAGNNITLVREQITGKWTITASFGVIEPYIVTLRSTDWTENVYSDYKDYTYRIDAETHKKGSNPQVNIYNTGGFAEIRMDIYLYTPPGTLELRSFIPRHCRIVVR